MKRHVYMRLLLTVMLIGGVVFAPLSQAYAGGSLTYDDVEQALLPYITVTDDGVVFDREQAVADGLSKELIFVGDTVNRMNEAYEPEEVAPHISIPVWGNWCGPGYGGGPPQDLLDQGCMEHDLCYDEKGYFSCECDQDLIDHIDRHLDEMAFLEKLVALGVRVFFSVTLCS